MLRLAFIGVCLWLLPPSVAGPGEIRITCMGHLILVEEGQSGQVVTEIPVAVPVGGSTLVWQSYAPRQAWWRDLLGLSRPPLPQRVAAAPIRARAGEVLTTSVPADCGGREAIDLVGKAAVAPSLPAPTLEVLMDRGGVVYARRCAACHGKEGSYRLRRGAVLGPLLPIFRTVDAGRPDTPMHSFGGVLSSQDLAAVVTYLRNAWGQDTGDVVTPALASALHRWIGARP
jgi:cytochrome c oxidase subunit II